MGTHMKVTPLAIPEIKLIEPKIFRDERGFFSESYSKAAFERENIRYDFVQDNHSMSVAKGVVRGLHFQTGPSAQCKLVRCVRGAIWDVAVDIRHGSPSYGRHVAVELSAENWRQLLIPTGFAHGFVTLAPNTEVQYKVDQYYDPHRDGGLQWDDPDLQIDWPVRRSEAVLSAKDSANPSLSNLGRVFTYSPE
jgi:dTDP-4-dehydrorhamnose 3,5-epimerase